MISLGSVADLVSDFDVLREFVESTRLEANTIDRL